jgi:pimeloyl-[acyl-carrier protein] methyl ester esterase
MASKIKHVCWLHGWGMSSRVWGDLPSLSPEAQHSFIDYRACATKDDFRHVLREHLIGKEDPVALIGWSMGGMLALEEVFRDQRQIEALAVIGSTLKFADEDRSKGWPARALDRMSKQMSHNAALTLRQFAQGMLSKTDCLNQGSTSISIDFVDWLSATDFTPSGLAAGLSYLIETDLRADWAAWRQEEAGVNRRLRLLWIHGMEDAICPLGCVPELGAGELVTLEHTGHAPMLTDRMLLKEQLRRFLHGNG